ncbi:unnamed protein product [Polarella glacialis]|uniref:Thioredoxin domain-containing protein n=1 Tax=Polarella glacialis TaxID=89957 RepID=A0A813JGG1_POLGL|nr:unnamed protein product [Polarella glacialis]|mmetsp:Transcript_45689/g.74221  ORF Transcript_45689/g.74221 Transcript_45689/m.74221 type:complete len:249 (-) Transcript_45689:141-887(-)
MLKNDKNIGIGAVDCELEKGICQKYGVSGYPTIKAIVAGKGKSYNGAREADALKGYITHLSANRGSKGGSAKCALGVFKSKIKDAVVPLCEDHYPDEKSKNDWLVFFYNSKDSSSSETKALANSLAVDVGNDPPDMNKALKKQVKRRDRLEELAKKYELKLKLPSKGPFGMDALIKVGAVCCDCDEGGEAFCASSLKRGEEDFKPPAVFWLSKGKRNLLKDMEPTAPNLVAHMAEELGFKAKTSNEEL